VGLRLEDDMNLSEHQMARIRQAEALLPANRKHNFIRSVLSRLEGHPCPSNYDVRTALLFVLNTRGVCPRHDILRDNVKAAPPP
jgi:hypothetical protein